MKMINYLEYCIRYWPYRQASTSIKDYLMQINIDLAAPRSETDMLLIMELLVNLLHFAIKMNDRDRIPYVFNMASDDMAKETERMIQNADYILEQCCNMQVRIVDYDEGIEEPRYLICKRDAYIDATVEVVPELADVLLGYMDIRMNEMENTSNRF